MNIDEAIEEHLGRLRADAEGRAMAQMMLREVSDLAVFPEPLQRLTTLAPTLYNAGTRRFEFQRTPNRFPGIVAVAFALGQEQDLTGLASTDGGALQPADGSVWKVLGGTYNFSVAATIDIKDSRAGRVFEHMVVQANVPRTFALPGNGALVVAGRPVAIKASAAGNLDLVLYVSEESDTLGRGAV